MPQAGVSTRARQRTATPWWEELDREAFRFPATYQAKPARRPVARRGNVADPKPVRAVVVAVPAELEAPGPVADTARVDGGRRTVTIRGHGAERDVPMARPTRLRHERPGFRPERAALWAVMLGLLLILVAAASAHAAMLH